MIWTSERIEKGKQLHLAIRRGQIEIVKELCNNNSWLICDFDWNGDLFGIKVAAAYGQLEIVKEMLELGFNVNAVDPRSRICALASAIDHLHDGILAVLLSAGADPNLGRSVIAALSVKDSDRKKRYLNQLVERGANLNQIYDLYGDLSKGFTALDWATQDLESAAYLRQHGAKTAAELRSSSESSKAAQHVAVSETLTATASSVIDYFSRAFGPVEKYVFQDEGSDGTAIAIHAVPASSDRQHVTLFTTGLSNAAMRTPPGEEEYAYAELFIELPGDWKYKELSDPNLAWPIKWLRTISLYPSINSTWLGGPLTIISNDAPPKPLAPNTRFSALLLLAEKSVVSQDGKVIQLYRITPLYPEEYDLERREGSPVLMRALDRASIPFHVDLNRPSVCPSI